MQIASIASAYDERGGDVDTLASAALIRGSVIVFLMLGVIALSTFFFAGQSLRLDEAQSLWQTSRSPLAMFQVVAQDVHVPLYHLMLHYWQVYLGNGVATARVLSLIFFVMMIPAIYVLGARAYSPPVGLFAAILTAASPFLNWYGNEIRMYSLFAFVTTVNQYYFLSLFAGSRRPDNTVKRSVWLMYGFSLIIGLCTHYFFSFNAAAQALFYFTHKGRFPRRALRNFIIIGCITLAIFTPWILFVINQGSAANTQPLLAKPTTIDLFNTFSQFMFGFQSDHINTILISLWPLLVLLIFLS
ncbi:MAG: glycosyltransferase family 39 protein, partial [Patescibacteria group bacterium]|nr:glycosyltransferase family 39 protein [Patescibacteria group bacterium]